MTTTTEVSHTHTHTSNSLNDFDYLALKYGMNEYWQRLIKQDGPFGFSSRAECEIVGYLCFYYIAGKEFLGFSEMWTDLCTSWLIKTRLD